VRAVLQSIEGEFRRYKMLAEAAMHQLSDEELLLEEPGAASSVATIAAHVAGSLRSRFTAFLTEDGEKPWRDRESEFQRRRTRPELEREWEEGWSLLFGTLTHLEDQNLRQTVTIRKQPLAVVEALHRALAHASYHVGQIVFVAKRLKGGGWSYLSIPPGTSEEYNRSPTMEKPPPPQDAAPRPRG
jgi:hypothetical protein